MQKLKYSFLDIKNNLRNSTIFLIQMVFVILIVGFSLEQILSVKEGLHRVSKLRNSESYIIVDDTSDEKVSEILNRENSIQKLKKLFWKIKNLKYSSIYGYQVGMDNNGNFIDHKIATEGFFDIYQIKVNEGRNFITSDYESINEPVPIIIGFELSRTYKLNQIYSLENAITGRNASCKVIGILPKNTSYPLLYNLSDVCKLDNSYIMPLSNHMIENEFQVPDFDMALSNTVITTENKADLDDIIQEANRINLFSIRFENVQDAISKYVDDITPELKYQLATAAIILIFACIGMVSHLSAMIARQRKDYAAHILCGAIFSDIILRLFTQVAFIFVLALVPCALFVGFTIPLLLTFVMEMIIIAAVIFIPIIKLYRLSIPQIIRRSE